MEVIGLESFHAADVLLQSGKGLLSCGVGRYVPARNTHASSWLAAKCAAPCPGPRMQRKGSGSSVLPLQIRIAY